MVFETIFLGVLVVSLLIGNLLLGFFSSSIIGKPKPIQFHEIVREKPNGFSPLEQGFLSSEYFSKIESLNQKILLLNKQLIALNGKFSSFENFRANTGIELKGVMEILAELQKKNLTVKSKKYLKAKKNEQDLSTEQMHKIIYRSTKKK